MQISSNATMWRRFMALTVVGLVLWGTPLVSFAQTSPPPARQDPPEMLPYKENEPIPPGYKVKKRVHLGLTITGSIILSHAYALAILGGAGDLDSDRAPYGMVFLPVLGPFIVAAAGDFRTDTPTMGSGLVGPLFVVDGLIQTAGAAMLLAGILAEPQFVVRQDHVSVSAPEVFIGPGSISMKVRF